MQGEVVTTDKALSHYQMQKSASLFIRHNEYKIPRSYIFLAFFLNF
jgi:hypothetical protein